VLLLDEPLSALDLKLRQHMRTELRAIQRRVGLTFIYITHDQGEALTMSDHVAVMREGVIEQIADGRTVYDDPASAFVASFVGENNAFTGQVRQVADGTALVATGAGELRARIATSAKDRHRPGDRAMVFIRPESFHLDGDGNGAGAHESRLAGRVTAEEFEGPNYHLFLEGPGGVPVKTSMVNRGMARTSGIGAALTLAFDPMKAVALPAGELAEEE
jgi:spermidine/putrescine transport system ATP-binding protein